MTLEIDIASLPLPDLSRMMRRLSWLGSTRSTWIYFVQADDNGPIKIGHAGNLERRLSLLRVDNPTEIRLLLAIKEPRAFERTLHDRFGSHRLRGEWFAPAPEILSFIEDERRINDLLLTFAAEMRAA